MSAEAQVASTAAAGGGVLPALRLKRGEDRRLRAGHLWVFSNEIDNEATPLTALPVGSIVRLLSDRDQFLGYAYVNPHALICARILSRSPMQPPDRSLLVHRLRVALAQMCIRDSINMSPGSMRARAPRSTPTIYMRICGRWISPRARAFWCRACRMMSAGMRCATDSRAPPRQARPRARPMMMRWR